jgi:Ring finger domain
MYSITRRTLHVRGLQNDYENTSAVYNVTIIDDFNINGSISNGNNNITLDSVGETTENQATSNLTWIICIAVFLFLCSCMKPHRTAEARRRLQQYNKRTSIVPTDIRNEQIEQSLSVQRVTAVDAVGNVQLEDICSHDSESKSDGGSGSIDLEDSQSNARVSRCSIVSESNCTGDNLIACCCICLEPYRVGDVVAWSNNSCEDCLHVFHKVCIHQWLENPKHDDCPSCRTVILQPHRSQVDAVENSQRQQCDLEDDEKTESSHNNTGSVVYYIMHGLISRARQARFSLIGQTISFDSDDDDLDCLYRNDDDPTPTSWSINPSPLHRALSFGDHMFRRRQSTEWKPMEADEQRLLGSSRRASTKVIVDSRAKLLQPHIMRRVASAGPGSPIDRKRIRNQQGIMSDLAIDRSQSTNFVIPLRRTLSLRQRLVPRHPEDSDNNVPNVPDLRLTRTSISWALDIDGVDSTERTEEDDILILKES